MDINEFYKNNIVDKDFDEVFYQQQYPETKNFYQPYCKDSGIDDKHRLYFHHKIYGNKFKQKSETKESFKQQNLIEEKKVIKLNDNKILVQIFSCKKSKKLKYCVESFFNNCLDKVEIIISTVESPFSIDFLNNELFEKSIENINIILNDFDILILIYDDFSEIRFCYDSIISNLMDQNFPNKDGCILLGTGDEKSIVCIGKKMFDMIKARNKSFFKDTFIKKCIIFPFFDL